MFTSKEELLALADDLVLEEEGALERCLEFIESRSKGVWHDRARAKMCRRLKHIELTDIEKSRLLALILSRLREGDFAEQFRDMLRLAIAIDPGAVSAAGTELMADPRVFVRKQASWILSTLRPNET